MFHILLLILDFLYMPKDPIDIGLSMQSFYLTKISSRYDYCLLEIEFYHFDFINFKFSILLQLMNSQGLSIMDLRNTLPNLKYLILSLASSAPHLRKVNPHNCTIIPN